MFNDMEGKKGGPHTEGNGNAVETLLADSVVCVHLNVCQLFFFFFFLNALVSGPRKRGGILYLFHREPAGIFFNINHERQARREDQLDVSGEVL